MKIIGITPARLESSRLSEKVLADIMGMPMVVHTCKRAQLASTLDEVYLATDSNRIRRVAEEYGINVIMTRADHSTGTDRLAEAIDQVDSDIVVNIQGDEPLLNPDHIDRIVTAMTDDASVKVVLGVTPCSSRNRASDIKAVLDLQGNVLYCSRNDLPSDHRAPVGTFLKMCFLVAFRTPFLRQFASWPPTPLERIEYNEYLRILEHGENIRAIHLEDAKASVDTLDDLERARTLMAIDSLSHAYMTPETCK